MTYAELICDMLERRLPETGIGMRFSPVNLSAADLMEIRAKLRSRLGTSVFIAMAAPDLAPMEDNETCLSSGERAAARATDWRNRIDVESGERIFYASVLEQGRAGGLRDTLEELSEIALRDHMRGWCSGDSCKLSPELRSFLKGVADRLDVRGFCAFTQAVEGRPLAGAGQHLPLLRLLPDSRLAEQADRRLAANMVWVRWAAEGAERSSSRLGADAREFLRRLKKALAEGGGAAALRGFDLGRFDLADLEAATISKVSTRAASRLNPEAPETPRPAGPKPPAPIPAHAPANTKTSNPAVSSPPPGKLAAPGEAGRPSALPPVQTTDVSTPPKPGAPTVAPPRGASGTAARQIGTGGVATPGKPEQDSTPIYDPLSGEPPRSGGSLVHEGDIDTSSRGEPRAEPRRAGGDGEAPRVSQLPAPRPSRPRDPEGPWTQALQDQHIGAGRALPPGLTSLLERLEQDPAMIYTWSFRGSAPRRLLTALPRNLPEPEARALPADLSPLTKVWTEARRTLLALLGPERQIELLASNPAPILSRPRVRQAIGAIFDAFEALLSAAPEDAQADVLALDTVLIRGERGELRVVSPLHPLWLGQWAARAVRLGAAAALEEPSRQIVAHAIVGSLHAPLRWPCGRARQADIAGLLTYGDLPSDTIDPDQARAFGESLARRMLEMYPYLSAGARVRVDAANPDPLVAGLLRGSLDAPLTVLCSRALGSETIEIEEALKTGRLSIEPVPSDARLQRCNVWIQIAPYTAPPSQVAAHASASGWPARDPALPAASITAPQGAPAGAAIEGALQRIGAATVWAAGEGALPLSAESLYELEWPAWKVIWASALSGRPPRAVLTIMREALWGGEVVVLAKDERAITSVLTKTYVRLGAKDERPSRMSAITRSLGAGGGLVSLDGGFERRIEAQLLRLLMLENGAHVCAALTATSRRLLAGADGEGSWAIGASWNGRLRLHLGYASIDRGLPLQRAGAGWGGPLVEALGLGVERLRLAGGGDLVGCALRELLCRALWPSIVAESGALMLVKALHDGWREADILPLCLLPLELAAACQGELLRAGGQPVQVAGADERLLERLVAAAKRG